MVEVWHAQPGGHTMSGAWGFRLGDTYLSGGKNDTNLDNCPEPPEVVGCLSRPPAGLGIPGKRTEDVTYNQRDGVKHFSDWYLERLITLEEVMVCNDTCGCGTPGNARAKAGALDKDWRRSCCDIEAVIYTDCNGQYDEGAPIPGQQTIRRNLIRNPSFEEDLSFWTLPQDSFCRTYDRCYNGSTWCYANAVDGSFDESRETDGGWVGDAYMRLTAVIAPTMPGIGFTYAPSLDVNEIDVVTAESYTSSAYLRASDPQDVVAQILWYDDIGMLLGVVTGESVTVDSDWVRLSVSGTAPENVDHAYAQWATLGSSWVTGGTLDIDGALFELGDELLPYFDGDSPDVEPNDPPEPGDQIVMNMWLGNPNLSESIQSSQTYEEFLDRTLYGPYGVVGRPRVADKDWIGQGSSCAEYLLRFDSPDQRLYVLDACGTPGYQQCRTITPGLIETCRSYDLCYSSGGRCYDSGSPTLVVPVIVPVGGTEIVHPLLVLYPGLSYPTIENMTNSQFIRFNAVVQAEAIQIDTENGIATGVDSGQDYTELLGGSIYMTVSPGENQFRMYTNASDDSGTAAVCWRDTVVSG